MDSPPKLHAINVQPSRNSIIWSTLISTSIIPLFCTPLSSLSQTCLSPSLSLSTTTCPTVCHSSWENARSHMGKGSKRGWQGIRGIIGMVGGVKSACSTTTVRGRGCRQMETCTQKLQMRRKWMVGREMKEDCESRGTVWGCGGILQWGLGIMMRQQASCWHLRLLLSPRPRVCDSAKPLIIKGICNRCNQFQSARLIKNLNADSTLLISADLYPPTCLKFHYFTLKLTIVHCVVYTTNPDCSLM